MRYVKSKDGIERVSIQVIVRLDREDIALIKKYLKGEGRPYDDTAVKEFVRQMTEYYPFDSMIPDEEKSERR